VNGTTTLDWRVEWRPLALLAAVFLALFYLPVGTVRFDQAVLEGLLLAKWYAREHVLLCLVPAFFIAGAIAVFVSDVAVMRYLGRGANKLLAYGVAAVSGTLLAVCSCTVLPLFASIHKRGAGLGPATAFLYSGPAINVLAITLTGSVLGWQMGLARAVGAVLFAVVIGLAMAFIFRRDEEMAANGLVLPDAPPSRPLWQNATFFGALAAILVFANWGQPQSDGLWLSIYEAKWALTAVAAAGLALLLVAWFGIARWKVALAALAVAAPALLLPAHPQVAFATGAVALSLVVAREGGEAGSWFESSWGFAKQIMPLLFAGVLVAGMLLGRPGSEGLIPSQWVEVALGGNSLAANLFAAVAGAFMYFATLTEVPIVQGLVGNGMGQGPALALLLAGPALSLPNMLVIASVLGWRKTSVYVTLVVVMATLSGLLYGTYFV
jgi:uncharacterized membrane protein YraQ (UPF0718 family)